MLKNDKSAEAPGRLDNLKELVRSMEQFESLAGFLEHVSLVMELEQNETEDRVNLMTLHAAKGLEFDTVFLPGWEEGLFPSQRTMDESGLAGLEEERRLAYVGLTRAKKRIRISFAANRRVHGSWQSALPSRFITELPEDHVETVVDEGFYGGNVGFRDNAQAANSAALTKAPAGNARRPIARAGAARTRPPLIEAQAYTCADQRSLRHAIRARRPRVPPEIRLWRGARRRRQQTHRRFRQGGREEGDR